VATTRKLHDADKRATAQWGFVPKSFAIALATSIC